MIDVRIQELWASDRVGIWVIERDLRARSSAIAKPVELQFAPHSEGLLFPEPTLQLPRDVMHEFLKALLDALAETRIIDSRAERREDEIKAIKAHLEFTHSTVDRLFGLINNLHPGAAP